MNLFDTHTHHPKGSKSIFNAEQNFDTLNSQSYFSIGLHPWHLYDKWEEKWENLGHFIKKPNCIAIGETGFDRLHGPDISIQKAAFEAQAKTAVELAIPLILHCVKGHDLLLEYLKKAQKTPQIIWHGWNLKPHLAEELLAFPVYFSFGAHLLRPGSNASKWLERCPRDRIFLETDDSNLDISEIYNSASLILRLPMEELGALTRENWNRISSRKLP
ncbi:TatD DNase family protein [Algoriphagus faecimaris]|uniref:TatD DNase family protein n=1 Tax=Algoriphagus faecimaris TaxID=686796 RepID=A0A1G6V750_9BACT|nr:TatD family hydrolase [Algoriphagus faecimaris]SDD48817.1 TatD DNase family protein [Algoriphagus faecimaris]